MIGFLILLLHVLVSPFKSQARLEAEIVFLRQSYWRWKSRSRGGRPKVSIEFRSLIRRMSLEKPLWGAPRIHGVCVPNFRFDNIDGEDRRGSGAI